MKVKHILLALLAIFLTGEVMGIKAFDDYGLKELNNRLTKFEKIIQSFSRQIEVGSVQAALAEEEIYEASVVVAGGDQDEETIQEPVVPSTPVQEMSKKEMREAKKAARKAAREAKKAAKKAKKGEAAASSIMRGSDTGYGEVQVPTSQAVGFMQPDGRIDLYDPLRREAVYINPSPYSLIGKTSARRVSPNLYYKNLYGSKTTDDSATWSADYLVLHNDDGDTLTITKEMSPINTLQETNSVATAGPIAGGRDQSGAFSASSWIYFYIIYNPTTGDVSSLSSSSATDPTLPTGYTYYARIGAAYFNGTSDIVNFVQIGKDVFVDFANSNVFFDDGPTTADVLELVDFSDIVPPTASKVTGVIGASSNATGAKGLTVKSGAATFHFSVNPFAPVASYGLADCRTWTLPIVSLLPSQIYWTASTDASIYGMYIMSYEDNL